MAIVAFSLAGSTIAFLKYNITPAKTFLLGFSQGTILSYSVALNHPNLVQKVIALSGYINPNIIPEDIETIDYSNLHFYCSHGSVDQVIPVDWARRSKPFLDKFYHCNQYLIYVLDFDCPDEY